MAFVGLSTPSSSRRSLAPIQLATDAMNAEIDGDILLATARNSSVKSLNVSTASASGAPSKNSSGKASGRPRPINGKFASAPVVLRLKPLVPPVPPVYPALPTASMDAPVASSSKGSSVQEGSNTYPTTPKFSFASPAGTPAKLGGFDFGIKPSFSGLDTRSTSVLRAGPAKKAVTATSPGLGAHAGGKKVMIAGDESTPSTPSGALASE